MPSKGAVSNWINQNYYAFKGAPERDLNKLGALVLEAPRERLAHWSDWYRLKGLFTEIAAKSVLELAAYYHNLPFRFAFSTVEQDIKEKWDISVANGHPLLTLDIKASNKQLPEIHSRPSTNIVMPLDPAGVGAVKLVSALQQDRLDAPASILDLNNRGNCNILPVVRRAFSSVLQLDNATVLVEEQRQFLESYVWLGE